MVAVLLGRALDVFTVDTGETVLQYGMDRGGAENEIDVGVIGPLTPGLITHAPVEHTGELGKGFFQDLMGDPLFRWVIDGQLPFTRLWQRKRPLL